MMGKVPWGSMLGSMLGSSFQRMGEVMLGFMLVFSFQDMGEVTMGKVPCRSMLVSMQGPCFIVGGYSF